MNVRSWEVWDVFGLRCVVELSGRLCNSECVWCFNQYSVADKIKAGFMSLKNFKRFVNLNKDVNLAIIPYGHGEALINPEFVKIMDYTISEGINFRGIHTNLSMDLTDDHFRVLCCLKNVVVNFGGGSDETQYLNMKTDLKKVLSNLKRLWEVRERLGSKVPVTTKMVINKRNINEVDQLEKRIRGVIPGGLRVRTLPIYFACSDGSNEDKLKFIKENLTSKIRCRDSWRIEDGKAIVETKAIKCNGLVPTVRWDGAVNICCRARYHDGIVGDAFKTPMREIVHSSEYRRVKKLGMRRRYIEYCKYCS